MKPIAAVILIILYFVTSTGATLYSHYCMGEIAGSSIWGNTDNKCGKCGMEEQEGEDSGCCNEEAQWIKIDDDQKTNSIQIHVSKLELQAVSFIFFNSSLFASKSDHTFPGSKAPLRSCELPTYLLNCVFRI